MKIDIVKTFIGVTVSIGAYVFFFLLSWLFENLHINSTVLPMLAVSFAVGILTVGLLIAKDRAVSLSKAMTVELQEQERLWETLTETSPVGILLANNSGQSYYANTKFIDTFDTSFSGAQNNFWIEKIDSIDRGKFLADWATFIHSGESSFRTRFLVHKNSYFREDVHVQMDAVPMISEKSGVYGFICTFQDMTELHNNQQAMVASAKLSSLGQMASGVAHEINNPLAIIKSKMFTLTKMIEVYPELKNDEKVKMNIQSVRNTVDRIAKIIKGLQSFARERAGDPNQTCAMVQTIDETLEFCRERLKNHGVDLVVEGVNSDMIYFGRSEQISQILLNLLNNAFDSIEKNDERWIRLTCASVDEKIEIRVTDSGGGISNEIQQRLFNPFFTTKEVGRGTGLGLSISSGIASAHNGRLYYDSNCQNTCFVLEIPIYKKTNEAAA